VKATSRTPSAERVVLAAASIAAYISRFQIPPGKELFVFSAAVVQGAANDDREALEVGIDSAAALLEQLPGGAAWGVCRGHLKATMEFAWLLLRNPPRNLLEEGSAARVDR
jgi:hypothetical protein